MKLSNSESFFENFIRLPGISHRVSKLPELCPECSCKIFFKQSDFRRSLGMGLVSVASILTFILMAMGYNWFLVWSPMLVVLIVDRGFYWIRPVVAICYNCEAKFRGLDQSALDVIEGFDLETHDRIHYPK